MNATRQLASRRSFIYLWPLRSSVLQGHVGRFQQPEEHIDALPCRSNATVKTLQVAKACPNGTCNQIMGNGFRPATTSAHPQ